VATNWLDPRQLDSWLRFGAVLVMLPAELDAAMQRAAGLTQFEYGVMAGLSESPDRTMRISRIAERIRAECRGR
jgi:hypothetical protein